MARLRRVHGVVSDIEAGATLSSSDNDKLATERLSRALSGTTTSLAPTSSG